MQVDGVIDLPVIQVSDYAGGWGYRSTSNAGVCLYRWMGFRVEFLGDILSLLASIFAITLTSLNGAEVGLSITYAVQVRCYGVLFGHLIHVTELLQCPCTNFSIPKPSIYIHVFQR